MISNATDILSEVKQRADASNHVVQLFAVELFKKEVFDKTHFINGGTYSKLYIEKHRLRKRLEWLHGYGICSVENENFINEKTKEIESKIKLMKEERKDERDSFAFNYLTSIKNY